jgi:hypothetical protein
VACQRAGPALARPGGGHTLRANGGRAGYCSTEGQRLAFVPNLGTNIPIMGTNINPSNLLGALFSRVQSRVLGILFGRPDQEFQLTEIISRADSGRGAVQRELEKLTSVGIIATTAFGNRRLYHANRGSPIFQELYRLILKTVGAVDPLREALMEYRKSIKSAFVYGSIAKGNDTAESTLM